MSTSYYYPQDPITSIRLEQAGKHDRVHVWVNGQKAGTLTVDLGQGATIVRMFADREPDETRCPMRTHWGGTTRGCVVTENVRGLDPSLVLISENGDPVTVQQVRDKHGAGRQG